MHRATPPSHIARECCIIFVVRMHAYSYASCAMRSSCSLVDGGGEVRGADGQTAEIVPQRGVRDGSGCWDRRGAMAGDDAVDGSRVQAAGCCSGNGSVQQHLLPLASSAPQVVNNLKHTFSIVERPNKHGGGAPAAAAWR